VVEFFVKAIATGDADLTVSMQFDDGGYNQLGTINVTGNALSFPWTFPITFLNPSLVTEKFHLDSYGSWYQSRYKIENNETGEDADIQILERGIVTYMDEYQSEED